MNKELKTNTAVLIACICIYIIVRCFRLTYDGEAFKFIRYHLTDAIAPIVVLSYGGCLLNISNRHSIKGLGYILLLCLLCSIVWEFCVPLLNPSSVADWIDAWSVFGGGIVYWVIINLRVFSDLKGE